MSDVIRPKKSWYSVPRHWFHVSTTLKELKELLKPRENEEGFNRSNNEPNTRRICVSPTLEQCLAAIPYSKHDTLYIYRTKTKVKARPSKDVFDSEITHEGWICRKTLFLRVGILALSELTTQGYKIITEGASNGILQYSKDVWEWWVALNPWQFVKFDKKFKHWEKAFKETS